MLIRQEGKGQEELGFWLITKILVAQERKGAIRVCGSRREFRNLVWLKSGFKIIDAQEVILKLRDDQERVVEDQEEFQN